VGTPMNVAAADIPVAVIVVPRRDLRRAGIFVAPVLSAGSR